MTRLEVDPESEGFGIIDLGWKIDTTGIGVLLWESDERRVVTDTLVLEPPVDEAQIVEAILDREERWPRLRGWVMDPNAGAQQMAQLLEKGEHPLQVERGSARSSSSRIPRTTRRCRRARRVSMRRSATGGWCMTGTVSSGRMC
jgi:hypothetical protein